MASFRAYTHLPAQELKIKGFQINKDCSGVKNPGMAAMEIEDGSWIVLHFDFERGLWYLPFEYNSPNDHFTTFATGLSRVTAKALDFIGRGDEHNPSYIYYTALRDFSDIGERKQGNYHYHLARDGKAFMKFRKSQARATLIVGDELPAIDELERSFLRGTAKPMEGTEIPDKPVSLNPPAQ